MIGARFIKAFERLGSRAARIELAPSIPAGLMDHFAAGRAFAEGAVLGNWRVDFFTGAATIVKPAAPAVTLDATDRRFREGLERGLVLAECANYARRLGATPPNICTPQWVAREAKRLARAHRLGYRVIDFAAAKRLGMGGLVNVGKGSANKPCLIVLEHRPPRARKGVSLAVVGKTMTYDTGGYSLKVNNGMKGMKYDKNGGMAVLGAMRAIALLRLPVHVVAYLPTAENSVSGDAYRPDDIITMVNGVSVEVTNTDAEGRLVLADALSYAARTQKPTAVIDLATLTGGVVVALGSWSAGLFCNDNGLLRRVEQAAEVSGERVWRLPLWKDHREFMRSQHADILNSNPKREGHPIQGAAFLSYFVEGEIPWAHIDIAGTSSVDADRDLFVCGPTGYGVRLVTELVDGYARS
jgi:leucyl aminopeptidase